MVSIKSLFVGALFAVTAAAQGAPTSNFNSSDVQSLVGSATLADRQAWCQSQLQVCSVLCGQDHNTCDYNTLNWTCSCPNGTTAALQYYPFSIVGNECNALLGNCLAAHANDLVGQNNCKSTYICGNGTQADATAAGKAAATATMTTSAMSSATVAATGTASSSSAHNAGLANYELYGPGVTAMAVLAGIVAWL